MNIINKLFLIAVIAMGGYSMESFAEENTEDCEEQMQRDKELCELESEDEFGDLDFDKLSECYQKALDKLPNKCRIIERDGRSFRIR